MLTKQHIIASLAFFFCFLVSVALAQQAKKPLSLQDIEQLLRIGVSSTGVARVIDDRGVNFEATEDVKERLRKAEADAMVIRAVERAAVQFARERFDKQRPKEGVDVAEVQRLLKALGYEPGPADGIAGARTREAVRSFQRAASLQPDGEISADLVKRLTLQHERRRLEEEGRKEEERRRAEEERRRLEEERRRAEEARRGEEVRRKAEVEAGQGTEEQYRTAVKYFFGSGVKKDYVEAARWYRKAAEQGHAKAQYSLGRRYYYGEGVIRTIAKPSGGSASRPTRVTHKHRSAWAGCT